jgi:hypothetical protein
MSLQAAAALLTTAFLFGGMTLFSFAFAGFLFSQLPAAEAGTLLRKAFPYFYLWVIVFAGLAMTLYASMDSFAALLLAGVAISTVPARQLLMPAINAATDAGDKSRFNRLHGLSVVIGIVQIGVVGYVLLRFI